MTISGFQQEDASSVLSLFEKVGRICKVIPPSEKHANYFHVQFPTAAHAQSALSYTGYCSLQGSIHFLTVLPCKDLKIIKGHQCTELYGNFLASPRPYAAFPLAREGRRVLSRKTRACPTSRPGLQSSPGLYVGRGKRYGLCFALLYYKYCLFSASCLCSFKKRFMNANSPLRRSARHRGHFFIDVLESVRAL